MSADTNDIRIGDFSRPVVEAKKPDARSPTKEALENVEQKLDEDARKDEASLKPMQSYEETLREIGVTRDKAADIVDAVLLKGFYAEDVQVTKTIFARLRTRNARDTKRAQEMIEAQRLTYEIHYNELLSRYLLAASLESFGQDRLKHAPKGAKPDDAEAAYRSRLAYVEELSDPALRLLFVKLSKFDNMIATVLKEGAIENF